MTNMPHKISGALEDPYDPRDQKLSFGLLKILSLPVSVDLRNKFTHITDQADINSCTGNGLAAAYEAAYMAKYHMALDVSRLFIYYNERVLEGSVNSDNGAFIRDGIKTLANQGVCTEDLWPHDQAHLYSKPSDAAVKDALRKRILRYQRINNDLNVTKAVIAGGNGVVVGIKVYAGFLSEAVAKTGIVSMPLPNEELLGGHCVVLLGYEPGYFWVRNSWGTSWGIGGYFKIPSAYIAEPYLCQDMWAITGIM